MSSYAKCKPRDNAESGPGRPHSTVSEPPNHLALAHVEEWSASSRSPRYILPKPNPCTRTLNQTHSQPTGMLRGQSSTTLHFAHAAALSRDASATPATPRLASTVTPPAPRSLLPMPLTTALAFAPPLRFLCDTSDTCPRSLSATHLQHARDASAMALRTRLQLLSD